MDDLLRIDRFLGGVAPAMMTMMTITFDYVDIDDERVRTSNEPTAHKYFQIKCVSCEAVGERKRSSFKAY